MRNYTITAHGNYCTVTDEVSARNAISAIVKFTFHYMHLGINLSSIDNVSAK